MRHLDGPSTRARFGSSPGLEGSCQSWPGGRGWAEQMVSLANSVFVMRLLELRAHELPHETLVGGHASAAPRLVLAGQNWFEEAGQTQITPTRDRFNK